MASFGIDNAMTAFMTLAHQTLESIVKHDVINIVGPIDDELAEMVHSAAQSTAQKSLGTGQLHVLLTTPGGVVESAERIVNTLRNFWQEITFIVPDAAMSAGTVLVMSGDAIMMDYFSVLGPIDPQVRRGDRLVPALSYLAKHDEIMDIFAQGKAHDGHGLLISQLDLAELDEFKRARDLSTSLLKKWLAKHKFKDWVVTESGKQEVTEQMKDARAEEIATALAEPTRWHSHRRGISMQVLREELNLRIDDFGANSDLAQQIRLVHSFTVDFMKQRGYVQYVHGKG